MSVKIGLHFTLVGRTDEWKRYMKDSGIAWCNADTLEYVRGLITKQFGNRPIVFANERNLINDCNPFPKYFSAGWTLNEAKTKELVVVAHSDSMDKANKLLIHHIKSVDWDALAKDI